MTLDSLKNFNNKAVDYLVNRLKTPEYRGQHLVQHYRYDFNIIYKVLKLLNEYAPNKNLLAIRTTDLKKRPILIPEWKDYTLLCKKVKTEIGKNTEDALRKLIFVDLKRIGFINTYNRKREQNDPYLKRINAFVSLTDDGLKLLKCKDELERSFLIGKNVDIFLNNCIENLLYILRNSELQYIDIYEYIFFMTAINFESSFELTIDQAIELIKEYRKLSRIQRKALINQLRSIMITKKGDIKGFDRRDFDNWKNEAQSLFNNFLKNTIYFQLTGTNYIKIMLSNKKGLFNDKDIILDRSSQERQLYMKNHKINKKDGFELHHIIPLAWATNLEHFKLLDNWKNMIYIDAYSHRQIKQQIILESGKDRDLKLLDYLGRNKEIYLKNIENVLYNYNNKITMLDKNKKLREIK
ncbi:MAG: hypothetical protein LBF97_04715 [Elusimicrobiota bacterium]|jgi:hypothetical protein|nr:hypothetical protein [Elusimicrobiota bacterium]